MKQRQLNINACARRYIKTNILSQIELMKIKLKTQKSKSSYVPQLRRPRQTTPYNQLSILKIGICSSNDDVVCADFSLLLLMQHLFVVFFRICSDAGTEIDNRCYNAGLHLFRFNFRIS